MRVWSADEVRAFLAATRGDRLHPCWTVAVTTGLRRSELLGLKWEDVDLDAGSMSVPLNGWSLHQTRGDSPGEENPMAQSCPCGCGRRIGWTKKGAANGYRRMDQLVAGAEPMLVELRD